MKCLWDMLSPIDWCWLLLTNVDCRWQARKKIKRIHWNSLFFDHFLKLKWWSKWGIKRKNLPYSRSEWEKSIVFRVFLTPSTHFQWAWSGSNFTPPAYAVTKIMWTKSERACTERSERGAARTLNQWLKRTLPKNGYSQPMSCHFGLSTLDTN